MSRRINLFIQLVFFISISVCISLRAGWAQEIKMSLTEHNGFTRFVFHRPTAIHYNVNVYQNRIHLIFDGLFTLNVTALRNVRNKPDVEVAQDKNSNKTTVIIKSNQLRLNRHFVHGNILYLDFYSPETGVGWRRPPEDTVPSSSMLTQDSIPSSSSLRFSRPSAQEAGAPLPFLIDDLVEVVVEEGIQGARLTFSAHQPLAVAIFHRSDESVWLVFNRLPKKQAFDIVHSERLNKRFYLSVIENETAATLKFHMPKKMYPLIKKQDGKLLVEFMPYVTSPKNWVTPLIQRHSSTASLLLVAPQREEVGRLKKGAKPVTGIIPWRDPEIGDELYIVPLEEAETGVFKELTYVDFHLLPTFQGFVIKPLHEDVGVAYGSSGVVLSKPQGLLVSKKEEAIPSVFLPAALLLNFKTWQGPMNRWLERKTTIEQNLFKLDLELRGAGRLDLARFYLAGGFIREAKGILESLRLGDPRINKDAHYISLMGLCLFLEKDFLEAEQQFMQAPLRKDPEMSLWLGAIASINGEVKRAQYLLEEGLSYWFRYPPALKIELAEAIILGALEHGQIDLAYKFFQRLKDVEGTTDEEARIDYLKGRLLEVFGKEQEAVSTWSKALENVKGSQALPLLYSLANARLRREEISLDEALDHFKDLRNQSRQSLYEVKVLNKLAELYHQKKKYKESLSVYKIIRERYPSYPQITRVLEETYKVLWDMVTSPNPSFHTKLEILAQLRQHEEVLGKIPDSHPLVEKAIKQFFEMDLLDDAIRVAYRYAYQRKFGLEKVKEAHRLAMLSLINQEPDKVPNILSIHQTVQNIPEELMKEARYLKAQAYCEQGQKEEALKTIEDDQDKQALLLKKKIYWRAQQWDKVTQTLLVLLEAASNAPSSEQEATLEVEASFHKPRLVLDLALAYFLANDLEALKPLREKYQELMAASTYQEAFDLVTLPSKETVDNMDDISRRVADAGRFNDFLKAFQKKIFK